MRLFYNLAYTFKKFFLLDRPLDPDLAHLNIQRVLLIFYVMVPMHFLFIVFFVTGLAGPETASTERVYQWRTGLISAHSIMLVLITLAGLAALRIRGKNLENSSAGRAIPIILAFTYLLFGAAACTIDQMVTASINPYLISSLAVALMLLINPQWSVPLYSTAFLALFFTLPLTQLNSELLLSMRVNTISATVIALILSFILWKSTALSFFQNKTIQNQTRELEKKNELLKHMARTDMLTGLYNRMRFTEYVEREISRIKRTGENSCLIMLDIDHFKSVNDYYGHPNGDTVLKWIAGVTKGQLRDTDTLARFGGEEFMILLPGTTIEGACKVAEKIRLAIEKCTFPGQMEDLQLTASFGIATLHKGKKTTFDHIYLEADRAIYRAKDKGRNRIECAG